MEMIRTQRTIAWRFVCILVVSVHFHQTNAFHLESNLLKTLDVTNSIPVSYRRIADEINTFQGLPATSARFLSSLSPFCSEFSVPEVATEVVPECIRWEEQELDMLLMYLELISVGMDSGLAMKFYEEIRCLSRANVFPVPQLKAWEVCFSYDYSEVVGSLLARYVLKDMSLQKGKLPSTVRRQINSTEKFFSLSNVPSSGSNNRLFSMFGDGSNFRQYSSRTKQLIEKSCCEGCTSRYYFVNVANNQCLRDPFGKHCCHIACKSLGHLKVGASSSTSYCCRRCRPLKCKR